MTYSQNIAKNSSVIRKKWPKVREHSQVSASTGNVILSYVVDPRPKKREYFKLKQDALNRAHDIETETHGLQREPKTQLQTLEVGVANDLLKDHGISLMQAAKFWIDQNSITQKTVYQARNEWLAEKLAKVEMRKPELSMKHYIGLKSCSKSFEESFSQRKVHTLTKEEFAKWVDTRTGGKRNRINIRRAIMNLMNYCVERGYSKDNLLRFKKADKVTNRDKVPVSILNIGEVSDLLNASKGTDCYAYMLLGLFAGLRPEEAEVVDWSWFENGSLKVKQSKTGPRIIKLIPELWEILIEIKGKAKGKITPPNFRIRSDIVCANAGWIATKTLLNYFCKDPARHWNSKTIQWKNNSKKWTQDILRHSYASYWLPIHHSYAELALHMGNSERIIKDAYQLPISESEAEKFWELIKS